MCAGAPGPTSPQQGGNLASPRSPTGRIEVVKAEAEEHDAAQHEQEEEEESEEEEEEVRGAAKRCAAVQPSFCVDSILEACFYCLPACPP